MLIKLHANFVFLVFGVFSISGYNQSHNESKTSQIPFEIEIDAIRNIGILDDYLTSTSQTNCFSQMKPKLEPLDSKKWKSKLYTSIDLEGDGNLPDSGIHSEYFNF